MFETTRVGIDEGSPCRVNTAQGELLATHVVVATQLRSPTFSTDKDMAVSQ